MPENKFDIDAARKEGYNDDDIISHLASTRKFDVDSAIKEGYTKQQIIEHLSTLPTTSKPFLSGFAKETGNQLFNFGSNIVGMAKRAPLAMQGRDPGFAPDLAKGIIEPFKQFFYDPDAGVMQRTGDLATRLIGGDPETARTRMEENDPGGAMAAQ